MRHRAGSWNNQRKAATTLFMVLHLSFQLPDDSPYQFWKPTVNLMIITFGASAGPGNEIDSRNVVAE